jgi:hypothetical protein
MNSKICLCTHTKSFQRSTELDSINLTNIPNWQAVNLIRLLSHMSVPISLHILPSSLIITQELYIALTTAVTREMGTAVPTPPYAFMAYCLSSYAEEQLYLTFPISAQPQHSVTIHVTTSQDNIYNG